MTEYGLQRYGILACSIQIVDGGIIWFALVDINSFCLRKLVVYMSLLRGFESSRYSYFMLKILLLNF